MCVYIYVYMYTIETSEFSSQLPQTGAVPENVSLVKLIIAMWTMNMV